MLTDIQQKLLQMMKELDGVCRNNDIHYTLGGGTAIGAIRHRGFLPWDDDIDLYMTRDNWEKFKNLEKTGALPPNRVIESAETDERYSNSMGRYVATDSSSVHSHQLIGKDPAGHVLDIFVFDPLDIENYQRYLEDLMLYSDLMDETKSYSSRLDMNLKRYPEALKRAEKEGRHTVVGELINSFTNMGSKDSDYYIMEWGTAPFLFPKSIFDAGYIRVTFEDSEFEIVRNYTEYLIWQYGIEWEYVPEHAGREGHEAIFSNKISYKRVREDYLPFINEKELHRAYLRRKLRLLKANPHRRNGEKASKERRASECAEEIKKRMMDRSLGTDDLRSMLKNRNYDELSELFEDYFMLQLGADFAGRRDKHSTLRSYMYPTLVPLDSETVEVAAELLMRTERMSKASRLIDIYTGDFEENLTRERRQSEKMEELKEEIRHTEDILNMFNAYAPTKKMHDDICEACEKYKDNSRLARLRLKMLLENPMFSDDPNREIEAAIASLKEMIPKSSRAYPELLKYIADYEKADNGTYKDIYRESKNGCIKLAIEDMLSGRGDGVDEEESFETEVENVTEVSTEANAREKASLYNIAKKMYRIIAQKDDKLKQRAWEIACRTRDRVELLEKYEDRIAELEEMRRAGEWSRLEHEMAPHRDAVMRNYEIGLGLCVHPILSELQYELLRREGRKELAKKIDRMVPKQHRKPIA